LLEILAGNELVIVRAEDRRGSLKLSREKAGAAYIFFHTHKKVCRPGLLEIFHDKQGFPEGPRIFSAETLVSKYGYPMKTGSKYYLAYRIQKAVFFDRYSWDYDKLPGRLEGRESPKPFTVTLDMLMQCSRSSSQ